MSDLSELIKIAKNIENQNTEIIRLLKKIAGEDEEDERLRKYKELLSYTPHEPGEVYFLEGPDIFKLSVENNETIVDNLTGDAEASDFELQELIANESIKNDVSLDDGTVILNSQQSQNLPETLKICVEQDAKKVFMPIFSSTQLVGAPNNLMTILKLDFYKSEDQLLEKLFKG